MSDLQWEDNQQWENAPPPPSYDEYINSVPPPSSPPIAPPPTSPPHNSDNNTAYNAHYNEADYDDNDNDNEADYVQGNCCCSQKTMKKIVAFTNVFCIIVFIVGFALAGAMGAGLFDPSEDSLPVCHTSPSGSALAMYPSRDYSFEKANKDCNEILRKKLVMTDLELKYCDLQHGNCGGKVVSITDDEHHDFIKKVRIQCCYY